jgi:hypothetical protein
VLYDRSIHSSEFDHPKNVKRTVQNISSSICTFPHFSVTSYVLGLNHFLLNNIVSVTLSLRFSLNVSNQVTHTYKTTGKFVILYALIFIFLKMIAGRQKIVYGIIASVPLLQSHFNFFLNLNTSVFSKEFISIFIL